MPLTDIADRLLKDPKKTRRARSFLGKRLKRVGDKLWQVELDGMNAQQLEDFNRP
jgi:hypothetical protein